MVLAEYIEDCLREVNNPTDGDAEAAAVSGLFGNMLIGKFEPPDKIKRLLLQRRLRYKHWKARCTAAWNFKYFLEYDVDAMIHIMRDGLNDPHPKVRANSVFSLQHALHLMNTNGRAAIRDWDAAMKERINMRRGDLVDEILDLIITKGLTDKNSDVVVAAIHVVSSDKIRPTVTRLRALDRVLDRKGIHNASDREIARKVRDKWNQIVNPGEPLVPKPASIKPAPDDPFADPKPRP